jgi:hypothetical protein
MILAGAASFNAFLSEGLLPDLATETLVDRLFIFNSFPLNLEICLVIAVQA